MKIAKVALIWGRGSNCLDGFSSPPPRFSLGVLACLCVAAAPDGSLWQAGCTADLATGGSLEEGSVSFTPSFLPTFIKLRLCVQALLTLPLVSFEWQTRWF